MKYAFILSWLTVEEWLDGLVWNTVLSHFTYLIEMSQEVDKSNVLLETKSRKQIVNNLFWCLYFSLLLKRKSSHYLRYLLHACACARSVVSSSLRPHGLYPPGSSVHGILQARVPEGVAISSSRGSFRPRGLLRLLHWQADSFPLPEPPGKPCMSARHVISSAARFRPTAGLLGFPLGFLSSCGHPLWVWGFLHSVLRLCDFVPVQNIIYYSSIIAHTSDTNILFQGPGYMDAGYQLPVT